MAEQPVFLVVEDDVVVNAVVGAGRPDGDQREWLPASEHPGVWIGWVRGEDGEWAWPTYNAALDLAIGE
jgi:hypothetical protein